MFTKYESDRIDQSKVLIIFVYEKVHSPVATKKKSSKWHISASFKSIFTQTSVFPSSNSS